MGTPMTIEDIRAFRAECDQEKGKPIRVSEHITVDHTPLTQVPDIKLDFIVGGSVFMSFDYRIIGGPDNGKRITLVPWRSKRSLEGIHEKYNGTHEEAENAYGYSARPAIHDYKTLHISTVMFLRGLLTEEREHLQAREIADMYKRLYEEREAEAITGIV